MNGKNQKKKKSRSAAFLGVWAHYAQSTPRKAGCWLIRGTQRVKQFLLWHCCAFLYVCNKELLNCKLNFNLLFPTVNFLHLLQSIMAPEPFTIILAIVESVFAWKADLLNDYRIGWVGTICLKVNQVCFSGKMCTHCLLYILCEKVCAHLEDCHNALWSINYCNIDKAVRTTDNLIQY